MVLLHGDKGMGRFLSIAAEVHLPPATLKTEWMKVGERRSLA